MNNFFFLIVTILEMLKNHIIAKSLLFIYQREKSSFSQVSRKKIKTFVTIKLGGGGGVGGG